MKYENEQVYLTFKTDRVTAGKLKVTAHIFGKTQPQLIEEICKDYIKTIETAIEEYNIEQQTHITP